MSLINGPGEGGWSVFAEKVVVERDAALEEVARLTEACADWRFKYETLYKRCLERTSRDLAFLNGCTCLESKEPG